MHKRDTTRKMSTTAATKTSKLPESGCRLTQPHSIPTQIHAASTIAENLAIIASARGSYKIVLVLDTTALSTIGVPHAPVATPAMATGSP